MEVNILIFMKRRNTESLSKYFYVPTIMRSKDFHFAAVNSSDNFLTFELPEIVNSIILLFSHSFRLKFLRAIPKTALRT